MWHFSAGPYRQFKVAVSLTCISFKTGTILGHATRQMPKLQPHISRRRGGSPVVVQQALATSANGGVRARRLLAVSQRASVDLACQPGNRRERAQGLLVESLAQLSLLPPILIERTHVDNIRRYTHPFLSALCGSSSSRSQARRRDRPATRRL